MKLLIQDDTGKVVAEISKIEGLDLFSKSSSGSLFLLGKIREVIKRKRTTVSTMPSVRQNV